MLSNKLIIIGFTFLMFSCNSAEKPTPEQSDYKAKMTLIEKGKQIALKTKAALGKNLVSAISTKGTEGALSFCSTQAIPITDSMSNELGVFIKRVSDKNRNPNNFANKSELEYIEKAKLALANGDELKPSLLSFNNKNIGYYPILTNALCLQCHGDTKTEITNSTLTKLNKLYPADKATGYRTNELRGIWVIEMK